MSSNKNIMPSDKITFEGISYYYDDTNGDVINDDYITIGKWDKENKIIIFSGDYKFRVVFIL